MNIKALKLYGVVLLTLWFPEITHAQIPQRIEEAFLHISHLFTTPVSSDRMDLLRPYCTPLAWQKFSEIYSRAEFIYTHPHYKPFLVTKPDSLFEIHNILIKKSQSQPGVNPHLHLILQLNRDGMINGLAIQEEKYHFHDFPESGIQVSDNREQEAFEEFIRKFETAYVSKNALEIEKLYDPQCLFFIGKKSDQPESKIKVFYKYMNRKSYLDRVQELLSQAKYFSLTITLQKIYKHPLYQGIYGIVCFQKWQTDFYEDEGYLFFIFDRKSGRIIYRLWQPDPF